MKCVCTELVPGRSRPVPGGSSATPISPRKRETNELATRQRQTGSAVGAHEIDVVGHLRIVACRAAASLIRTGGSTHPFAVWSVESSPP